MKGETWHKSRSDLTCGWLVLTVLTGAFGVAGSYELVVDTPTLLSGANRHTQRDFACFWLRVFRGRESSHRERVVGTASARRRFVDDRTDASRPVRGGRLRTARHRGLRRCFLCWSSRRQPVGNSRLRADRLVFPGPLGEGTCCPSTCPSISEAPLTSPPTWCCMTVGSSRPTGTAVMPAFRCRPTSLARPRLRANSSSLSTSPTQLAGSEYLPGELVLWDGVGFSSFAADGSWPISTQLSGLSLLTSGRGRTGRGTGSGRFPSLTASLAAQEGIGEMITLSWGASCTSGANDYAIYEGPLDDDFTQHAPVTCSTGGVDQPAPSRRRPVTATSWWYR